MDKEQFKGLRYNPFELKPHELMWKHYPDLAKREQFCKLPEGVENFELFDLNKMLKFTVVYIDPLSPLYEEKDFELRMDKAMNALGYDKEKERFFEFIRSNSILWNTILFTYFKLINNHIYESWYTQKINFHLLSSKLRGNMIEDTNRRAYTKMINDTMEDLIEIEHKLFPDEYTMNIIAKKATEAKVTGFAEKYALKLD